MRFREIVRFEVSRQLRQPSTWMYLVLLLGIALLRADSTDVGLLPYHAPAMAAFSSVIVSILATLVTAGLFVEAAHRDLRWRIDPLFFTSPLRKWDYLGGRFLGVLLINALLLLAVPAGLLLGSQLHEVDPEMLGRLRPGAYLLPYLVFLLPNLLVSAAILFGITVMSGRSLSGYLASLVLVALYLFPMVSGIGAGNPSLWPLLDPTGSIALSTQTEGWSRVEMENRLIEPSGLLLWNRLLWTAVGAGVLAFTCWRFRLAHFVEASHREPRPLTVRTVLDAPAAEPGGVVTVPPALRSFGLRTHCSQTLAVARIGIRQTVLSRDFLLIAMGLAVFALLMLLDDSISGAPVWPLTAEVLAELTGRAVVILIALLTIFYAGELVWRERDTGLDKIADSTPVPDWVPFAGKFLALTGMLVALQAVLMVSGILAQALQGYYVFKPGLYLKILFSLQLADYLLFAVLALLTHVLVNQKYLGHVVAALLFIGLIQARRLGIEHNLLVYGSDPGWTYSDLNAFGPFLAPVVWFKLYWAAWALLLGVVALLFWMRGVEGGLRRRLRMTLGRLTPRMVCAGAVAVLLILVTGGFIFYNTNILNEFRTASQESEIPAEYERRYKRYEHLPQPRLTAMRLHAEIYPERREAAVRGNYLLVNRTGAPIDSVYIFSMPSSWITLHAVRFDRAAEPVLNDPTHGFRIYALSQSLEPGDSLQMHFEIRAAQRGFRNREQASSNAPMVGDFTNLGSWVLPAVGYQREHELSSARKRREHGLPPSDLRPSVHDQRARQIPRIPRIRFEGTVGTAHDHTAVMPGALQRTWTEGDRRYFHYRAEAPILNFFSILSAEYAVHEATWNDVEIRVLYHPDHGFNVERMVRSAQVSLDYFTEQFGPYPHRQFWLVETPRYWSGARAYGGQLVYSERSPMTLAREGAADRIYGPLTFVAHELSHQWWGQQVMGADVEGSQVLSETLAQYSAAMVLERTRGAEHARRFLRSMHTRYLNGRGRHETPEAPLMLTTDHAYVHYGKGAVVMYALRDYLGKEQVNAALNRLVRRHAFQGPPYATTLDLYEELQAVTPDSLQYLLEDLLATITLWDLQASGARAEPTGSGGYRLSLDVHAAKLRSDSVGNEVEVPMDDWVEIGVFAAAEGGIGEPLYLEKHRILSGSQRIIVTVPQKPDRAGIDPHHLLIDRDLENNVVNVEEVPNAKE